MVNLNTKIKKINSLYKELQMLIALKRAILKQADNGIPIHKPYFENVEKRINAITAKLEPLNKIEL